MEKRKKHGRVRKRQNDRENVYGNRMSDATDVMLCTIRQLDIENKNV